MTDELKKFYQANKKALFREYLGYLEEMIDSNEIETSENFFEWLDEELQVAREYQRQGTPLNDYQLV